MRTNSTQLSIIYNSKDISIDIAPFILSFSFTDNSKDKADDISLQLEDNNHVWLNDWLPSKGDIITASIIKHNGNIITSLPCGSFTVDQVDYSAPPSTLTIKAVSSSIAKKISQQKKTRQWENITLPQICAQIASDNSLALMFNAQESELISRADQTEQSDLEFLQMLCADYGLAVKIQESRLIIYDIEEQENSESVMTISSDDARLISYRFSSKAAKIYKSARVRYHDPVKDETFESEYTDESEEGSERELEISERVESQGAAQRLARQRLAEANRGEITGNINLVGDTGFAAGMNITLSDFGLMSGKYFITKASHSVTSSGYTVSIDFEMPQKAKAKAKGRKRVRQTSGEKVTSSVSREGEHYYGDE